MDQAAHGILWTSQPPSKTLWEVGSVTGPLSLSIFISAFVGEALPAILITSNELKSDGGKLHSSNDRTPFKSELLVIATAARRWNIRAGSTISLSLSITMDDFSAIVTGLPFHLKTYLLMSFAFISFKIVSPTDLASSAFTDDERERLLF